MTVFRMVFALSERFRYGFRAGLANWGQFGRHQERLTGSHRAPVGAETGRAGRTRHGTEEAERGERLSAVGLGAFAQTPTICHHLPPSGDEFLSGCWANLPIHPRSTVSSRPWP